MVFLFTPGKALGCNINTHRRGWSGTICADASTWNCSADQSFRDDYCARGSDRCYHLHVFDARRPRFLIDDNGVGWMLHVDIHALDDQILLLWGADFAEPRGIREGRGFRGPLYGAYRIKTCNKVDLPHRVLWEVEPHADGWTRCHNLRIPRPTNRQLGGKYLREIDRGALLDAFSEGIRVQQDRSHGEWFEPEDSERFRHFHANLEPWLELARAAAEKRGLGRQDHGIAERIRATSGPAQSGPLSGLPTLVKQRPTPSAVTRSEASAPPEAMGRSPAFLESGAEKYAVETYGERTLRVLRIAALTKPLLILRGNTGVGKSELALRLLDDPAGERTCVIPVAATWRGREDLLGYVNPVSGEFEPTEFTRFLFAATAAWQQQDRRPRHVVFEEFNLSQPEHWMSDVLVVSQYADPGRRLIHLGGKCVRGIAGSGSSVQLSPAVRFVATINNDHTTRPLSPRVLDRAAVVELDLEPSEALRLAGRPLDDEHLLPITELDELLRSRGASFSLRAARSLHACMLHAPALGLDLWQAIDAVMVQEVLSKVRLLARDPVDAALMQDLQRFGEKHGANLSRCAQTFDNWVETLKSGADVVQA